MENPLITVLVPIYNAEPFLGKLFDSVLNQTYKNIEMICVDDISTDNSAQIIREYAKHDDRIRLISRKEKGGTAAKAEEFAIPYMRGEYYFFLSQDDFIDYDLLDKCIKKVRETQAEIIVPNMIWYYEEREENDGIYPPQNDYDQLINPRRAFELSLDWSLHGFVLKSMRIVKALNYKADYYNSDELYSRKAFLLCNKVAFVDAFVYYRQDNPSAITKSKHYFDVDMLHVNIQLLKLLIQYHYSKKMTRTQWYACLKQAVSFLRYWRFRKWDLRQRLYIIKGTGLAFCELILLSRFLL